MDKFKVSICIPLYNSDLVLSRCLESIQNQKINEDDYEVVIYDDCSTDDSLKVAKSFKKFFKNFKVIEGKKNNQLFNARQNAILKSSGKYIVNIDPDDYFMDGYFSGLFELLDKDYDIICVKYILREDDKETPIIHKVMPISICSKVIKRKYFNLNKDSDINAANIWWQEDYMLSNLVFKNMLLNKYTPSVYYENDFSFLYDKTSIIKSTKARKEVEYKVKLENFSKEVTKLLTLLIDEKYFITNDKLELFTSFNSYARIGTFWKVDKIIKVSKKENLLSQEIINSLSEKYNELLNIMPTYFRIKLTVLMTIKNIINPNISLKEFF